MDMSLLLFFFPRYRHGASAVERSKAQARKRLMDDQEQQEQQEPQEPPPPPPSRARKALFRRT